MALADFIRKLSRRTGLNEDETRRGVAAVLTILGETVDRPHLEHALALLPHEYRLLAAA